MGERTQSPAGIGKAGLQGRDDGAIRPAGRQAQAIFPGEQAARLDKARLQRGIERDHQPRPEAREGIEAAIRLARDDAAHLDVLDAAELRAVVRVREEGLGAVAVEDDDEFGEVPGDDDDSDDDDDDDEDMGGGQPSFFNFGGAADDDDSDDDSSEDEAPPPPPPPPKSSEKKRKGSQDSGSGKKKKKGKKGKK